MIIRELVAWDGPLAILLDGGDAPRVRPPLHLQAAAGGHLRLVGANGPLLWGRVQPGWWGIEMMRGATPPPILPPLRADEVDRAPIDGARDWWTRRFATLLSESAAAPLAPGRRAMLMPLAAPSLSLEELRAQGNAFALEWDIGTAATLLLRPFSDPDDGRVAMWRKQARRGLLPPVVMWWCKGLFAHVVLDGHDRLQAALLEDTTPALVVLEDVVARSHAAVDRAHDQALHDAALLDGMPWVNGKAAAMNRVLRGAWDPRAEWDPATPGFPLDAEEWREEVRGTELAP